MPGEYAMLDGVHADIGGTHTCSRHADLIGGAVLASAALLATCPGEDGVAHLRPMTVGDRHG